jgi:hypothetical protein
VTSFRHSGFSGFGLRRHGDTVQKWTRGENAILLLKESMRLHSEALKSKRFSPLRAVPIVGFWEENGEFFFEMPFYDLDSGFTTKDTERLKSALIKSLENRSCVKSSGFKKIIAKEIEKLPDTPLIDEIIKDLRESSDEFIEGPVHGDFGLANMLVGKEIYLIDFTPSFIHSPLMDIATLEMSIASASKGEHHVKMFKEIRNKFKVYRKQIDIIRKTKAAGFKTEIQRELFDGID